MGNVSGRQLKIENISNLSAFTKFVEKSIKKSTENTLWYRGCNRASYELIPSLCRHPNANRINFNEIESKMINWFKERSMLYMDRQFLDDFEYLFYMQHYGVPTRLLDWTENPFIALYFALVSAKKDSSGNYIEDVAIWILDPVVWNRKALKHLGYKKGNCLDPYFYQVGTGVALVRRTPVGRLAW